MSSILTRSKFVYIFYLIIFIFFLDIVEDQTITDGAPSSSTLSLLFIQKKGFDNDKCLDTKKDKWVMK